LVQFRKIRLSGFKSFVEPTDFLIEPGLTGIVGPVQLEGSDRSYWFCSEACRWIFLREPQKYARDQTIIDLALAGKVPNDFEEFLRFSGVSDPSLGGDLYEGVTRRNGR